MSTTDTGLRFEIRARHRTTGMYVKKIRSGGWRWSERGSVWRSITDVRRSLSCGVLRNVDDRRHLELVIDKYVVRSRHSIALSVVERRECVIL